MIQEHSIKVEKTARVFSHGEVTDSTQYIWFICHGYGQLAYYLLKKIELSSEHYLVAPEALSHFYLDEKYAKVGASWMTKEGRENEIQDYIGYLEKVYEAFIKPHEKPNIKIIALGFSQGCATISRWAAHTSQLINHLVFVGGVPANELLSGGLLKKQDTILSIGEQDEYFKNQNLAELEEKLKPLFKTLQIAPHTEGHVMNEYVIKTILDKL